MDNTSFPGRCKGTPTVISETRLLTEKHIMAGQAGVGWDGAFTNQGPELRLPPAPPQGQVGLLPSLGFLVTP